MVQRFLVQLSIVHYQVFGCRPRFSHKETGTAVLGVVPISVLRDQASADTLLHPSLYLIGLFFRSRIGSHPDLVTHEIRSKLEVHLYQFVAWSWGW